MEHLREYNYMADMAKLEFDVDITFESIDYEWSGFNDRMVKYISETLKRINQMKTTDLT